MENEGDCKTVVDALNGIGRRSYHIQTMVDNCRSLVKDCSSLRFLSCSRKCNSVSHRLVEWAASGICDTVWDIALNWLEDVLYSDFEISE